MKGKPIPRLMRTDPCCTRHLDNQSKLDGFCSELAEQFVQTCIVFMLGAGTQTRLAPSNPRLGSSQFRYKQLIKVTNCRITNTIITVKVSFLKRIKYFIL